METKDAVNERAPLTGSSIEMSEIRRNTMTGTWQNFEQKVSAAQPCYIRLLQGFSKTVIPGPHPDERNQNL